jgi:hypothetical protein
MINGKSLSCVIGLCCVLVAQTASAQPRWGRERLPDAGACFYENINFGGRYFCVRPGEQLTSLPSKMGDEISSMRLVGAAEVTIFKDKNMRGRSARFAADERDLRREGWNDQISSLVVGRGIRDDRNGRGRGSRDDRRELVPVWGRAEPMPRQGACFYEDANFEGRYFCVARGAAYPALPRGFNDRISSIRVFDARVQIFQNDDFRGRSTESRGDVRNLRGNWRDTVSSIRVY